MCKGHTDWAERQLCSVCVCVCVLQDRSPLQQSVCDLHTNTASYLLYRVSQWHWGTLNPASRVLKNDLHTLSVTVVLFVPFLYSLNYFPHTHTHIMCLPALQWACGKPHGGSLVFSHLSQPTFVLCVSVCAGDCWLKSLCDPWTITERDTKLQVAPLRVASAVRVVKAV